MFDVGVTQDVQQVPGLKLGIDTYYKYARNLLDEGQFGAPVILTPFNYNVGYSKGVELTTTYDRAVFITTAISRSAKRRLRASTRRSTISPRQRLPTAPVISSTPITASL